MELLYGFIIDTDSYSGNFEREMCAFMTGRVGDCGVGGNFTDGVEVMDDVVDVEDEGCWRPVTIYPTPTYYNNGLGFSFRDGEEAIALEAWQQCILAEETRWIGIEESHRGKNINTWTDEAIDDSKKRRLKNIEESKLKTSPFKYDSYQSVLIYFSKPVTEVVAELLKSRAREYVKGRGIKIESFRDYTRTVTETSGTTWYE